MDVSCIFCHFELHDGHNLPHYKHVKHSASDIKKYSAEFGKITQTD